VAALDSDESGDLSLSMSALYLVGRSAENHVLRMPPYVLMDQVNLVECFLHRWRTHGAPVNPNGKENGVHTAFVHSRDVYVAVGVALTEIIVLREKPLRSVIVGVEHDRREMQLLCALRNVVGHGAANEKNTRTQTRTHT
jgi:hypothetical protein